METITNYIEVTKTFQFFSKSYAFIDACDKYLADQIFINKKLKVKFDSGELHNNGNNYRIVFCKIKKKDEKLFIESMKDLKNKMILLGYKNYDECCKDIWESIGLLNTK